MPLLDHFHAPLYPRRSWESFHALWASSITAHLNQKVLPKRCFSETQVHVGGRVEIDVGTFDLDDTQISASTNGEGGIAVEAWAPPAVSLTIPAIFPDEIEIRVFHEDSGYDLVGAIELVSPGNKDRVEAVEAFTAKCLTYLQQGVGLLVVDVVTSRLANMHAALMLRLNQSAASELQAGALNAVSYRPHRTLEGDVIDIWPLALTLGKPLPTMPLGLRRLPIIPVDLETTYVTACEASRL